MDFWGDSLRLALAESPVQGVPVMDLYGTLAQGQIAEAYPLAHGILVRIDVRDRHVSRPKARLPGKCRKKNRHRMHFMVPILWRPPHFGPWC